MDLCTVPGGVIDLLRIESQVHLGAGPTKIKALPNHGVFMRCFNEMKVLELAPELVLATQDRHQ